MDLKLLLSSDRGFRGKFIATVILFLFVVIIYALVSLLIEGSDQKLLTVDILPTMLTCILFMLPILLSKFIRWRIIEYHVGLKIPLLADFKCWISSQAFLATPGGSGLGLRSLLLKRKYNIPISASLPSIIFERLTDVFSIIFLAIFINIDSILKLLNQNTRYSSAIVILLILLLFLILILPKNYLLKNKYIISFINKKLPNFRSYKDQVKVSITKLFQAKVLLISIIIGTIPWCIEGYSLSLIVKSISSSSINLSNSIFAHSSAGLLGALSLLPGGLGTTEASTIGLLNLFGIPLDVATQSAILVRLFTIWLATLIGIISLTLPSKIAIRKNFN